MADEINVNEAGEPNTEPAPETRDNAEIARLKAALDKATREAADSKRELRARQSAEEAAAAEAKERQEATERELEELRRTVATEKTAKRVMGFVGDEAFATAIAEALYGSTNTEAAVAAFEKAWTAKEKALRLEYGKIPAPGVGANTGTTVTREQLDKMTLPERTEFASKFPEDYNKLMGR